MIDEKPIAAALSRNLGGPTTPGELAEKCIDSFIKARDKQRRQNEGERPEEAAWKESERRVEVARRESNRREWGATTTEPGGALQGRTRLA